MTDPTPQPDETPGLLVKRPPLDIERKLATSGIAGFVLWGLMTGLVATYDLPLTDAQTVGVAVGVTELLTFLVGYMTKSWRRKP